MLVKLDSQGRLTLPDAVIEAAGRSEWFDIIVEGGKIILAPVRPGDAEAVRQKLAKRGIQSTDIDDAVAWARRGR